MKTEEFNKIIKERQAEYQHIARKKRQDDLVGRIPDMNLKSGNGLDPLQLFPKEIWMMMINQVSPEDKLNFRNAHELFKTLTEDKLFSDILLPMIIGFKMERFWDEPEDPQKAELSPLAQYTELRLLSKSMRNTVDRWFEDDIISKLRTADNTASPSLVVSIDLRNFNDCQKIARMKRHLSTSSPEFNRFFTRSLHIVSPKDGVSFYLPRRRPPWADEPLVMEKFLGNVGEILDIIGNQIWYFHFEFNHPSHEDEPKFAERYASFIGWLGKMPQLKWLKVTINQSEKDSRHGFRLPEESLPVLSHLERLDSNLKQKNRYILPVCLKLLTVYSHVKFLSLQGWKSLLKKKNGFVGSPESSEPPRIPLNLEGLMLDGTTRDYPIYDLDDLEDASYDENGRFEYDLEDENFKDATLLQSIFQSNWPLKEIDWNIDMRNEYIGNIFHVLGKVKTLEKIRLSLDEVFMRNNSTFLELPHLKHFEFMMKMSSPSFHEMTISWSFLFSLQFLLLAKNLETLIWKCDMDKVCWVKMWHDVFNGVNTTTSNGNTLLDFEWVTLKLLGISKNYYDIEESNIWRIFRRLDTVTLELSVRRWDDVEKSVEKKFFRRKIELREKNLERRCSSSSTESEEGS